LSPLVQHRRAAALQAPGPGAQHWGMLLFESLSAGVMTIFVCFVVVMLLVGGYVIIVWPLTFWDLARLGLEKYGSWALTIVWSLFAGGSLAGFWCFSGNAFRRPRRKVESPPRPVEPPKEDPKPEPAIDPAWLVSRVHRQVSEGGSDDPQTPAPGRKEVGKSGSNGAVSA